jgi:hypothetical protein
MIYNQKEHEKWQKKAETDMSCVLVLAEFEMRKHNFLRGYSLEDFFDLWFPSYK